ncbi:OmpA family protein [Mucilaginibacter phyllosphaerae]
MKNKAILLGAIVMLLSAGQLNAAGTNNKSRPVKMVSYYNGRMSVEEMTKNLEFDFCKADIPFGENQQLNELAKYMLDNNAAIAIRGHADAIGTYVGNWKMSDKRANCVKDYLIKKGVAKDKIITTPFGSTIPIASNKTAYGRQRNRRVELRLQELKS